MRSAREGERCGPALSQYEAHCVAGLSCADDGLCRSPADLAAQQAARETRREQAMLAASGVDSSEPDVPLAEAPLHAGPGLPVRVASARAKAHKALAACRPDERLIGGGCNASTPMLRSFPSHFGESDTVGARWNCEATSGGDDVLEAYALCQALPAPTSP